MPNLFSQLKNYYFYPHTSHAMNEEAKQMFRKEWNTYRQVIDHNFMKHKEIIDIVGNKINQFENPTILDLGCGDALITASCIDKDNAINYTGIDASDMALDYARVRLSKQSGQFSFINNDLFSALEQYQQTFDVIIAGYLIHHFSTEQKSKIFNLIKPLLSDKGIFIFYDLELKEDETKRMFIDRSCRNVQDNWLVIGNESIASLKDHITHCDIPESREFYWQSFKNAGFQSIHQHDIDPDKLFTLYILS